MSQVRNTPNATQNTRWLTYSNLAKLLFQISGLTILARLLSPAEFGAMAIVVIISNFAGLLRDLGTGAAIVQADNIDEKQLNAVFLLNVVIGFGLMGVLVALSDTLAHAFNADSVARLITYNSVVFPIISVAGVQQALLERNSRFIEIAIIETFSYASGLGVAVFCAYWGFGVTSLVFQSIVTAILNTLAFCWVCRWKPAMSYSWSDSRKLLGNSVVVSAYNLSLYITRNTDQFIVSTLLGTTAVGFYSQAQKLTLLPQQLTAMTARRGLAPKLASLQNDLPQLQDFTARALAFVLAISGTGIALFLSANEEIVATLLGSQWNEVPKLLVYLMPSAVPSIMTGILGGYFIALGARKALVISGWSASLLLIICVWVGSYGGVTGVCIGILVHALIVLLINMSLVGSAHFYGAFVRYCFAPASVAICALVTAILAKYAFSVLSPMKFSPDVQAGFGLCVGGVASLVLMYLVDRQNFQKIVQLASG